MPSRYPFLKAGGHSDQTNSVDNLVECRPLYINHSSYLCCSDCYSVGHEMTDFDQNEEFVKQRCRKQKYAFILGVPIKVLSCLVITYL